MPPRSCEAASGIESNTLASTLFRLEKGYLKLTSNHVVVLDEAGMVPTKLMAKLIDQVEKAKAKLVLVGDAAQLQAIGAGGPFKSISERVGQCQLTQIRRQKEQWRRDTVEQFSRGEAKEALIAYAAKGQLHVTKSQGGGPLLARRAVEGRQRHRELEGRAPARLAQCRGQGD